MVDVGKAELGTWSRWRAPNCSAAGRPFRTPRPGAFRRLRAVRRRLAPGAGVVPTSGRGDGYGLGELAQAPVLVCGFLERPQFPGKRGPAQGRMKYPGSGVAGRREIERRTSTKYSPPREGQPRLRQKLLTSSSRTSSGGRPAPNRHMAGGRRRGDERGLQLGRIARCRRRWKKLAIVWLGSLHDPDARARW